MIAAIADLIGFFTDLPYQAPGDDATTRAMLDVIAADLPAEATVLDLGCGTGRSTLVLARALRTAQITAVDLAPPFLAQLDRRAAETGLAERITTRCADMASMDIRPESVDLIWCEGAVYNVGFDRGLALWRPWLKPGGFLVVSEAVWWQADVPDAARAFWHASYPQISNEAALVTSAEAAGFEVKAHAPLPQAAWQAYYTMIERHAEALADEPRMVDVVADLRAEAAIFAAAPDAYGYLFLALRKGGR